jgi:5-methylcytosine-specific restriction endonuclease McrA
MYTPEQKEAIFNRTRGKCHLCHTQLSFRNHGRHGARGAWHVDHSVPLARGGSHHPNNLRAACIPCNLDKSTVSSRTARRWQGQRRAPLTHEQFEKSRETNTVSGGVLGAAVGGILAGPLGAWVGGVIGVMLGADADPEQ